MKIHIMAPQRRKPKIGDRRTTKKHGLQIRVVETHNGMWVCSGSRYRYEWMRPSELVGTQWEYLLTKDDRAALERQAFVRQQIATLERAMFFGSASAA